MSEARPSAAGALARSRLVAGLLLGALLVVFVSWHARHYTRPTALIACTIGVVPWLIALRPLWRGRPDAYLGGLLLTTPYLGYGLMELVANPGARAIAATTVFVSFLLAVALTACLRLSRPAAPAPT